MMRYGMMLSAVAAFIAVPCSADIIPNAVFSGQVTCDSGLPAQTDSAGTFSTGCAMATLSYQDGEASITVSGYNTDGMFTSGVSTEVTYYFEVVGSTSEPVPLDISGSGSASATSANNFAVYGSAGFITPFGDATACSSPQVGACPVPSPTVGIVQNPFSVTLDGDVTPGRIYEIDVSAGGDANGFFGSSFSASIDPQVTIDPSFADASDFTLEFSPNPTSAVPEPSSTSLLLVICLGLGAVRRFRFRPRRVL